MRLFTVGLGALILLLVPFRTAAQNSGAAPASPSIQQQIRTRIEAERRGFDALDGDDEVIHAGQSLTQFYEQRGFEPAWVTEEGLTPAVDSLLRALRRADREGLNPGDYHVDAIAALRRASQDAQRSDPGRLSDLEFVCTDAFLLFASHLLSGHVSPTALTPSWNVPRRQADLLQLLTEAARTGAIAAAFDTVRPPQPEYRVLTTVLQHYRALAANGGWPTVPDGPKLEPGASGERVARVRERLAGTGGDSRADSEAASPETFGPALERAVVAFQERHGLEPDGVVGAATLAALNVPVQQRIQQLIVNLERWRWMPRSLGDRHILVNIAAAHLRLVEDGTETLTMRVVTGRPYRQTPVFSGEISYLVFHPYWHVPPSIATRDKLPELQKDPGTLVKQGFKVFRGWGADAELIDPATVDWAQLSRSNFPYRLRQDPGPFNALGRVKFMFPNPYNVYLHDTPTRELFARAERSFSSGCIRLERPIDLAERLLAGQPEWTPQRMQSVLKGALAEQAVTLRRRMPVHLQYWTAWAEKDGTVHFRSDAYNRDGPVQKALDAVPPPE